MMMSKTRGTATFDAKTPHNVVTCMRQRKGVIAHSVNQDLRKEIVKLEEDKHSDCLYPQQYAGKQIDECLHRLLNAVNRFRSASAHYVEGLLSKLWPNFDVCSSVVVSKRLADLWQVNAPPGAMKQQYIKDCHPQRLKHRIQDLWCKLGAFLDKGKSGLESLKPTDFSKVLDNLSVLG